MYARHKIGSRIGRNPLSETHAWGFKYSPYESYLSSENESDCLSEVAASAIFSRASLEPSFPKTKHENSSVAYLRMDDGFIVPLKIFGILYKPELILSTFEAQCNLDVLDSLVPIEGIIVMLQRGILEARNMKIATRCAIYSVGLSRVESKFRLQPSYSINSFETFVSGNLLD